VADPSKIIFLGVLDHPWHLYKMDVWCSCSSSSQLGKQSEQEQVKVGEGNRNGPDMSSYHSLFAWPEVNHHISLGLCFSSSCLSCLDLSSRRQHLFLCVCNVP